VICVSAPPLDESLEWLRNCGARAGQFHVSTSPSRRDHASIAAQSRAFPSVRCRCRQGAVPRAAAGTGDAHHTAMAWGRPWRRRTGRRHAYIASTAKTGPHWLLRWKAARRPAADRGGGRRRLREAGLTVGGRLGWCAVTRRCDGRIGKARRCLTKWSRVGPRANDSDHDADSDWMRQDNPDISEFEWPPAGSEIHICRDDDSHDRVLVAGRQAAAVSRRPAAHRSEAN